MGAEIEIEDKLGKAELEWEWNIGFKIVEIISFTIEQQNVHKSR